MFYALYGRSFILFVYTLFMYVWKRCLVACIPQLATIGSTVSWKEYRIRYTKKDAKTFSLLNGIYFSWAYWMNDKTYSHNTGMSRVMERHNDMEEKWCKKNWHTEGLQFMYMMLCCAVNCKQWNILLSVKGIAIPTSHKGNCYCGLYIELHL